MTKINIPVYACKDPNNEGYFIHSCNKETDNYIGIIETEANAKLIVKAVNCHDDLVEALKRALNCENKNGILSIPCIEQMKQALEKASQ